jgi:hypothetical protein
MEKNRRQRREQRKEEKTFTEVHKGHEVIGGRDLQRRHFDSQFEPTGMKMNRRESIRLMRRA